MKPRPKREHPGQKQLSCWLDADLVDRMAAHVRARPGAQLRVEIGAALAQYLETAAGSGPPAQQAQ